MTEVNNTIKEIKVYLDPEAKGATIPKKGTDYSAGYDVSCLINFEIPNGQQIALHTGVYIELPKNCYAELRTRSSMAKDMVRVEAGIIDSDYRGELIVLLYNYGPQKYISKNLRIAQMIIHPYGEYCIVVQNTKLAETNRKGGFGSTNYMGK